MSRDALSARCPPCRHRRQGLNRETPYRPGSHHLGEHVDPFLSSVDNGWFAAALMVVRNAEPAFRQQADALLAGMDFGAFYDANQFGGTRPGAVHLQPLGHPRLRAPHRDVHRHRAGADPARGILRDVPHVPGKL
jgi:hypothetical protein